MRSAIGNSVSVRPRDSRLGARGGVSIGGRTLCADQDGSGQLLGLLGCVASDGTISLFSCQAPTVVSGLRIEALYARILADGRCS
jgi:hypothetical protein